MSLNPLFTQLLRPFAPRNSVIHKPVEYEEGYCSSCNGSGEGMYDGQTCHACKGSGSQWYQVEVETKEEDES